MRRATGRRALTRTVQVSSCSSPSPHANAGRPTPAGRGGGFLRLLQDGDLGTRYGGEGADHHRAHRHLRRRRMPGELHRRSGRQRAVRRRLGRRLRRGQWSRPRRRATADRRNTAQSDGAKDHVVRRGRVAADLVAKHGGEVKTWQQVLASSPAPPQGASAKPESTSHQH